MYNDTLADQVREIGAAHMTSKIKTAPLSVFRLNLNRAPSAGAIMIVTCLVTGPEGLTTDEQVGIPALTSREPFSLPQSCRENVTLGFGKPLTDRLTIHIVNMLGRK